VSEIVVESKNKCISAHAPKNVTVTKTPLGIRAPDFQPISYGVWLLCRLRLGENSKMRRQFRLTGGKVFNI